MPLRPLPPVSEREVDVAIAAIDACLEDDKKTDKVILSLFKDYAVDEDPDSGKDGLTFQQTQSMTKALAGELRIPEFVFYDIDLQFQRFDFNGGGLLDKEECRTMYKVVMRQRRADLGGNVEDVQVPFKTLDEGGYTVVKELGRGGQGAMYLATKQWDRNSYCIKFYDKGDENAGGIADVKEEFMKMKQFQHKNCAKTYEVFQDSSFYYLCNEPYFGGDLTKLAKKAHGKGIHMSEAWFREICRQTLVGMQYLHSQAQMHCDLKEPNIMIAKDDSFKAPVPILIDFGLARGFATTNNGTCGTPGYMPPEVWTDSVWHPRGDTFSLGVVFFQLLTGGVPNEVDQIQGVLQEGAMSGDDCKEFAVSREMPWDRFPTGGDFKKAKKLIHHMTKKNFKERPRITQCLEFSWFSSTKDAPLPEDIINKLVGGANRADSSDKLLLQLMAKNNLEELRAIKARLDGAATMPGLVPKAIFKEQMCVCCPADDYADDYAQGTNVEGEVVGLVPYDALMQDAISQKEKYSHQAVRDMFTELDANNNGYLTQEEIKTLLNSNGFECSYKDVDDVIGQMDADHDGQISWEEFKRAVLEDGRIARKSVEHGVTAWCWSVVGCKRRRLA